jgi:MFS family permease
MTREISTTRRWSMLIVSLTTTLCATVFINGVVFLIPALKAERHMGLAEGALWSATPSLGMAVTLFAWGYLLDRIGERIVLTVGLALTAAAAFAAASVDSMPARDRLVPTGAAWRGDGDPPDRAAVGNRVGRLGDAGAGQA